MIKINIQTTKLICIYLFYFFMIIEDTLPMGQLFTFLPLLALVLFTYIKDGRNGFHFHITGVEKQIIAMLCFCTLSMIWAENSEKTFMVCRALIIVFIMMSVLKTCLNNDDITPSQLLKIIAIGGYSVAIYAIIRFGWSNVLNSLNDEIRVKISNLNGNTVGMCAAYAIVIDLFFALKNGFKPHNLLAVPSIVMIAASGSRKALIITIVGVFCVFVFKNRKRRWFIRSIVFIGIISIIIVILSRYVPLFSGINKRMESLLSIAQGNVTRRTEGYLRTVYLDIGWSLFKEHPLLGIGIHNASNYIENISNHVHLHNTVIELLACGGIVGFLVYYSAYFYLMCQYWKNRNPNDDEFTICFILLIIRMIMSFGFIEYFSTIAYFYFMLFWIELYRIRERKEYIQLAY